MVLELKGSGAVIPTTLVGESEDFSYGCSRPALKSGELGIDYLIPAVDKALEQAGLSKQDVQVIVNFTPTADGSCIDQEHVGPRLGHGLQKALGLTSAYVFDLMDTNWVMALDTVEAFLSSQGLDNALIVRADSQVSIDSDPDSLFQLPGGGGCLVVQQKSGEHGVHSPSQFHSLLDEYESCRMLFRESPNHSEQKRFQLDFPYQQALDFQIEEYFSSLVMAHAADHGVDAVVQERWWPGAVLSQVDKGVDGFSDCFAGAFEIPKALEGLALRQPGSALLLCFDPFNLSLSAKVLKYAGREG